MELWQMDVTLGVHGPFPALVVGRPHGDTDEATIHGTVSTARDIELSRTDATGLKDHRADIRSALDYATERPQR